MTDQISLDAQGLWSALAILQCEQIACVPTERERRLYRWFNICVYSMAALFVLLSGVGAVGGDHSSAFYAVLGLLGLVSVALMLGTIVLFFLNWGLIRKLYRHAQLRKRLKLADYFASAFSAERKATVVGNVVTMLTFIVGWLLILASFFGAVAIVVEDIRVKETGLFAVGSVYLVMFLVGVSFISFRYVRRGKQRLEWCCSCRKR
jgi:ABC-type multidrug transport system permease subunit